MSGALHRVCRALIIVSLLVLAPQVALSQIAPTNTAVISGSVRTSSGSPVAGATVTIAGPKNATTKTDTHGYFVFVGASFGAYAISVQAAGLGTATQQVRVEGDVNIAIQYQPQAGSLKTIASVTTRSNVRFNVTAASISAVYPTQALLNGQTSWRNLIEPIPGVSFFYNFGDAIPDVPSQGMQFSIGGTLPYETSTTLDGMPLAGGYFGNSPGFGTALDAYPMNGFSEADIIRGPGANAPSIVDSIGGSLVLSPPGRVDKNYFDLSLSNDPYFGINQVAVGGLHLGKLSAVLSWNNENSPGPSNLFSPHYALPPFSGVQTIDGRAFQCLPTPGLQLGNCYNVVFDSSHYANPAIQKTTTSLIFCCPYQDMGWNLHSFSGSLNYALSNRISAKVYYAGQTQVTPAVGGVESVGFTAPPGYTGSLPVGDSLIPFGDNWGPTAFNQYQKLLEEQVTAQIGAGILRLEALQNDSIITEDEPLFDHATAQLYGGGQICSDTSPNCSTGTYNPITFNGSTHTFGWSGSTNQEWQDSFSHDKLISYATPVGNRVQVGGSFVTSTANGAYSYNITCCGGVALSGSSPFSQSLSTRETRLYVGGQPSTRTSLDLSWYLVGVDYHLQSDPTNQNLYTDVAYSYSAPRLGFVWRPTSTIAVRAAAGGGFAEAPLGYLEGTVSPPSCANGICTAFQPNLNLQPEKSFAVTVGTDVRLNRDTVASFDLYRANLFGQPFQSTTIGSLNGLPLFTTEFENLGHTRYEGLLLDVHHNVDHGFEWALSGGFTRGYVVSLSPDFYNGLSYPPPDYKPTPCTMCANLNVVPNINFNESFAPATIPYAQANISIGYQWKDRALVNLTGAYYGNNNSLLRRAFTEWDASASYPIGKTTSLFVTFRNLTNVYPAALQAAHIIGVPTVSGPPWALFGSEYGPPAVIMTAQFHINQQ